MDSTFVKNYRTIGKVQAAIGNASTLDEALRGGLKAIVDGCEAENAVIWYIDKSGDGMLHPYYWIGSFDLTSQAVKPGEGYVGSVYESQQAVRALDFKRSPDSQTKHAFTNTDVTSMICTPFTSGTEAAGCVQFVNKVDGSLFTDEEADICEIMVTLAAIAIEESDALAKAWSPGKTIMQLRDITREFESGGQITKVLKGVNLDVYEGEFLVLLGESGCGKSTLLNIMGGMDSATDGTFSYLDSDYSYASQKELTEYRRENIGFVFQSYNLMPNLTALNNLKLIAELVDTPMDADAALDIVGLADRKGNYPSQLSGGQQQRVSIARALVKNPKVIFADEPTAALDYATSIEVLQVLERIVEQGTTLVMVTHNEEITRMANRVVRMRDGRIHEVTVNRRPAKASELVW